MRRLVTVAVGLALTTAMGVGPAGAAAPSAVLLPRKAVLLTDGSVQISMKVRCNDRQQAFEWSIEIRQGAVYGNDSAGPTAGLITCDGRFHTVDALVPGANGPYSAGRADVQALVQLYDADEGSDVQLEDREVVRLRSWAQPRSAP